MGVGRSRAARRIRPAGSRFREPAIRYRRRPLGLLDAGAKRLGAGNAGPIFINNTGAPVEYVQLRAFTNEEFGGAFNSELKAYYIEDEWRFNDSLTLYIGARQDTLTNFGTTGVAFADFEQDWAPRLGMSWDPIGDGNHKVYGTWGRYFLPMANNTNFRVGSGVSDTTTYYAYTGVNPEDSTPTGLVPLGGDLDANNPVVNSASAPPTRAQFQAAEADAFFKDELILGYERYLENGDSASIRLIQREVGATLDDYINGLRLANRDEDFRTMLKVMTQLYRYPAALPWRDYDELIATLQAHHAFDSPDEGLIRFSRALRA